MPPVVPMSYRWLLTGLFLLLVVVLSITPVRSRNGDSGLGWLVVATPMPLQKLLHVAMYAILVFLIVWAMENVQPRLTRHMIAVLAAVAIGALLEWSQTRVEGRFGSLLDVLLNGAGALIGALAAALIC